MDARERAYGDPTSPFQGEVNELVAPDRFNLRRPCLRRDIVRCHVPRCSLPLRRAARFCPLAKPGCLGILPPGRRIDAEPRMADAKTITRLSAPDCRLQADGCRDQARRAMQPEHRSMLERMAESWEQLAADIERRDRERG
jgi:hypothetical protein